MLYPLLLNCIMYTNEVYPELSAAIPHSMLSPFCDNVGVHFRSQYTIPGLEGSGNGPVYVNLGGLIRDIEVTLKEN